MSLVLELETGAKVDFPVERWYAEPSAEEQELLDGLDGPVLDVGCGPGRHVLALNRRGVIALGIDASPVAVALARQRGAAVMERSVFDRVPGTGRWGAALLLDGNIGIGGDPVALLRRLRRLLRPGGIAAVEVEAPGLGVESLDARLDDGLARSAWFRWARVGADGLDDVAAGANLIVDCSWEVAGRWFARLRS